MQKNDLHFNIFTSAFKLTSVTFVSFDGMIKSCLETLCMQPIADYAISLPINSSTRTLQHSPHKDKSDCGAVLWAVEG